MVLWGAYYLPARLRQRNQLSESRVDDRFSGSLRVLTVSGDHAPKKPGADRDCSVHAAKKNQLLTAPMSIVTATSSARSGIEGKHSMDSTAPGAPASPQRAREVAGRATTSHSEVKAASTRRPPSRRAPVAGGAARAIVPSPAVRARRAAAARRRLLLTASLLALSVGAWIAVAATALAVAVPIVLTAAFAGVLGLGRNAVRTATRNDAALRARLQTGAAPVPSRRAPSKRRKAPGATIIGRAIRASSATTEMISSAEVSKRAGRTTSASAKAPKSGSIAVVTQVQAAETAAAPTAGEHAAGVQDAATEEAHGTGELGSYTLPRSTYTTKAHAPRREPAPLTDADVTTPASAVARAKAAEAAEAAARAAAAVEDDVEISPDGLGVDLNRILARRRASGA